MAAHPLKYAVLALDGDWLHAPLQTFAQRDSFLRYCKVLADQMTPYSTFERRVRKDGRWLWHPCETRFFDANGK